jgi:hypothetical protein
VDLPEVARVERLTLRPGDRVVVTVERHLTDAEFGDLRAQVRGWGLPEGSVIIVSGGMTLSVLEGGG